MSTLLEHPSISLPAVADDRPNRLLLVAYNFPPVGGAGVQRPVKWVKNLRRMGWDVTVLTTENPSVPARDESLLADIPDDVLVIRARTWEPDYRTKQGLVDQSATAGSRGIVARVRNVVKGIVKQGIKLTLQPDPQVLWVPNAIRAGRQILREVPHDAILVTAPAYSSFFIGTALKRRSGLPLVLDFRDEWDMSGRYLENAQRDRVSRMIQERMQQYVLCQADAVVATTRASTENLARKLARLKKPNVRTAAIYNGFDAEDFASAPVVEANSVCENQDDGPAASAADPVVDTTERVPAGGSMLSPPVAQRSTIKKFRLLYTGTLWNLTTIEPLVEAVLRLHKTAPDLVARLELVCVGRKTPEQTAILQRLRTTPCRLELVDYCEHARVLDWLRSTDAVCLLLSDVTGAERVVPAKLFEYLANRRDMLAIVPRGETADIVRQFFPAGHVEPKDIDGIAAWLKIRLAAEAEATPHAFDEAELEEFSRATQTRRLVTLLDELVQSRHQTRKGTR
jgi:glycosyltransferase involved in cell wall biosynthesis